MNEKYLKSLAKRLCRLVASQSGQFLRHSQALDAVPAVLSLKNWNEVIRAPDVVANSHFDIAGAERLAHRLKEQYGLDFAPPALFESLARGAALRSTKTLEVWPTGPAPGVYVATSDDSVQDFLFDYEESNRDACAYVFPEALPWDFIDSEILEALDALALSQLPRGSVVVLSGLHTGQDGAELRDVTRLACEAAAAHGLRVILQSSNTTPGMGLRDVEAAAEASLHDHLSSQIRGMLS